MSEHWPDATLDYGGLRKAYRDLHQKAEQVEGNVLVQGPEMRKWTTRLLISFTANLNAMEQETRVPKKIVTQTRKLIKDLQAFYDSIG